MPWDAMIFMLSGMRHRTDPDEKSEVWQLIGNVYSFALLIGISPVPHPREHEYHGIPRHKINRVPRVFPGHIKTMSENGPTPLHMAIQHLIVKAWRTYIEECHRLDMPRVHISNQLPDFALLIGISPVPHPREHENT
jgi:hypothetical protein